MATVADGSPTKEFFIDMLTRDIALNDAILDLLDNCLDGVIRVKGIEGKWTDKKYYQSFYANITLNGSSFEIKDNCGGIPRKVAEENAFRMGRTSTTGSGLPTVGIYGIGMKRAIFKIGREATVLSKNNDEAFTVKIEKEWANTTDWHFPIKNVSPDSISENGTSVCITGLTEGVLSHWSNEAQLDLFIDSLISSIQTSYSLIIEKGFHITVNGVSVNALPVQLLVSTGDKGIKPYMFKKDYDDVRVQLAIGFYASPPSDDEIDESNESKRSSADAGWTIVCNDRVVLYNDRSHLTGWGEAGVPQYHTQFIGIRGIVIFESNNPEKLPMTTTKRGIDLSSPIYSDVKNKMREGMKMFTSYTNQWKGRNTQEREYSTATESIPYTSLFEENPSFQSTYGIALKNTSSGSFLRPELPKPPIDRNYMIIRFSKSKEEIETAAQFFYDDASIEIKPSEIGEKCFDKVLSEIQKTSGGE